MSPFGSGIARLTLSQIRAQGKRSRYVAAALSLEQPHIYQRVEWKWVVALVIFLFASAGLIIALGLVLTNTDASVTTEAPSPESLVATDIGPPLSPPPPPPIPRAPPYPSGLDCGGYIQATPIGPHWRHANTGYSQTFSPP